MPKTKLPSKRNWTAADYAAAITSRENDLRIAREILARLSEEMTAVHRDFREKRKQLLRAAGQARQQPQRSGLDLKFFESEKIRSPRVVWRSFVRLKRAETKRPDFLNGAIHHRRQHEWTERELAPYAHPAELALVMATEAQLVQLRKRVQPLQEAAKNLSTAVTQLTHALARVRARERMLAAATQDSRGIKTPRFGTPATENQVPTPMRPQFRHPDGVL